MGMVYKGGAIPINLEFVPDEIDRVKVPDEYKNNNK